MDTDKNIQEPEGFIPRLAIEIYNRSSKKELWENYMVDYKEDIDDLYFQYLEDLAIKEATEKYPVLKMDVADTDLPKKVKDALLQPPYPITKVDWLIRHNAHTLKQINGIGPKAIEAIKVFFAKYGIDFS